MKKVFLGGTCNNSNWRNLLIPMLRIEYFNPVVKEGEWTDAHYQEELRQREICDYCLYVISPLITGVYSIAEVVDDSHRRPEKNIFCILKEDTDENNIGHLYKFTEFQIKSLNKVGIMVIKNGGKFFTSLEEIAEYLNASDKIEKLYDPFDIQIKNDGKEKHQSFEAVLDKMYNEESNTYFDIQVTGYGANEKESIKEILNSLEIIQHKIKATVNKYGNI